MNLRDIVGIGLRSKRTFRFALDEAANGETYSLLARISEISIGTDLP
jgi:hypothetical protein